MKAIIMGGGGGGVSSDELTATKEFVLEGLTAVTQDSDDEAVAGTMTNQSLVDPEIGGINAEFAEIAVKKATGVWSTQTSNSKEDLFSMQIPKGYYDGTTYVGHKRRDVSFNPSDTEFIVNSNWNDGIIGQVTINPTSNLIAANILAGKTVGGVAGTATSDANAVAANILASKTAYVNGNKVTGTMASIAADEAAKSFVFYNNVLYLRMSNGAHVTNASSGYPEVHVTSQTKSVNPSESAQTVSPDTGKVLQNVTVNAISKTYVGSGVTRQAAKTVTPGASAQTAVASGVYTTGAVTVSAVSNLSAGNIKNGVTVGGVAGTFTSDGTVAAADMVSGKIGYSKGSKVTGTMATLAGGTYTPSSSSQTISCSGKKMTSNIVINAIPSSYVNVTANQVVFNNGVCSLVKRVYPYMSTHSSPIYPNTSLPVQLGGDGVNPTGIVPNGRSYANRNYYAFFDGTIDFKHWKQMRISISAGCDPYIRIRLRIAYWSSNKNMLYQPATLLSDYYLEYRKTYTFTYNIDEVIRNNGEVFFGFNGYGRYYSTDDQPWVYIYKIELIP